MVLQNARQRRRDAIGTRAKKDKPVSTQLHGKAIPLVPAIIFLMFILHSGNSNFTKETAPVKRDDNLTSAKALEKNAATLNRVLNAILFHNELQNGSVTMKDFVAESMGFQDASRFDSIKTIHVQKTVKYMGLTDFISNQTSGKLDELVIGMRKLEMQNLPTLTSAKVAEILSLFSNYAIDDKFRYWIDLDSIKDLLKPFQKGFPSSLDEKNAVNTFDKVDREVVNVDALLIEMKNLYNDVVAFEEKLNSTYILNIEKFLQETNTTDIPNLNNAFSSLNASFDYFVSWWNVSNDEEIKNQLHAIMTLLGTNVSNFRKQALVGFPNGLNDLEKLSGEFADHWLMAVLNGGKTLDLLKKELMPLLNITKDLKSKEVASIDLGRHVYFSAVRKVFNNVEIMNSKDPLSVLNAFSKAKNDLLKLQQTFGFDNSIVQEVKEVIRSNADFTNFKDGLSELLNSTEYSNFKIREWKSFFQRWFELNEKEKFKLGKESPLFQSYSLITSSLSDKIKPLESKKKVVGEFFEKVTKKLSEISKIVEAMQTLESIKTAVENYVQILRNVSPISESERKAFTHLNELVPFVANKLSDSEYIDSLKKKINMFSNQMKTSLISRELTVQLAYSQQVMDFYINHLKKIVETLESSGNKLKEKIETLSSLERQIVGAGLSNITDLTTTLKTSSSDAYLILSKMSGPGDNFNSFKKSLSAIYNVKAPTIDTASIISTLDKIKSTSIGRSQEVVDVEESLDQLELLQFAVMRKNGSLSSLIDNAENFFTDFFKEPSDPDHNWLLIAAFSTFIIVFIVSVGLYCFVWKRVKKNKEKSSTKKCLKNEHSKDNNSKEKLLKEEHSKDNNSKEKLLKEEHSKDNNSKEKLLKEEHSKNNNSKEKLLKEERSKDNNSKEKLLKEEHSKDNNSKEKHSKKKEAQKKEPKEREIQAVQNSDGHAGQSVNDANRNACASQNQEEQNSDGSAAQNESNMSMKEKVPVETFSLPNLDVMGPIKAERADKMLAS